MNLGYSWATVRTLFASLCAFCLTTWEEYHTGTLYKYLGLVHGPVWGVLTPMYAITALKGEIFLAEAHSRDAGITVP